MGLFKKKEKKDETPKTEETIVVTNEVFEKSKEEAVVESNSDVKEVSTNAEVPVTTTPEVVVNNATTPVAVEELKKDELTLPIEEPQTPVVQNPTPVEEPKKEETIIPVEEPQTPAVQTTTPVVEAVTNEVQPAPATPQEETIDFDSETPQKGFGFTKEEKKDNKILLIALVVLFAAIIIIPKVWNHFNRSGFYYTNKVAEKTTDNLVDGYIPLGKEAYMTLNKIKFYNFKKSNSVLSYNYIASDIIEDPQSLNLYIQVFTSNKELIFVQKFGRSTKIEKSIIGEEKITLNSNAFSYAAYIKVTTLTDADLTTTSSLTCTKEVTDGNTKTNYSTVYSFTGNRINKYNESVEISCSDDEDNLYQTKLEQLTLEYNKIATTNAKDIKKEQNKLSYTIDVVTFEAGTSGYTKKYHENETSELVKLIEELEDWTCSK